MSFSLDSFWGLPDSRPFPRFQFQSRFATVPLATLPIFHIWQGQMSTLQSQDELFAAWCLAILANCMDPHPKHVAISTQKPQDSMPIDLPIQDHPNHSPSCGRDCSSLCSSKLRDYVHRTSSTLQLNPS